MSAPLGPRASSNSRGQSHSRTRPQPRVLGRGGGVGRNFSQQSLDTSMGDAPAGQQSSLGRPRGESGARRQTSPRRARGESRGAGRAGRHESPGASRGDGSQQHYKPPPLENKIRNKSWVNPASLNASFQSHAGRVVDPRKASWRNRPFDPAFRKQIDDLYQTLKEDRKRERIKAIKDGFLADPAKPTTLDCAITPVGTCQDMCPEFERVERIMQNTVEGMEKVLPSPEAKEKFAFEDIMVKKFRRSAAGYEEQLPSDIRPPLVLQKTLDYLINGVVGGPEALGTVHGFVWDRTRSIRNDFSIQQVTKIEDVKIAIDCFERIVRFHILSLHQLSGSGEHGGEFNAHQERTQLNNALLSLHHYYEDNHNTFISPNEAEFRAYAIIFEIQDLRPDVEDRLQNLPKHILKDQRVRTALKLYAAAGNSTDQQGPLQPQTRFMTAQANTGGFWSMVQSNSVSYLMACVTEIYFNHVRRTCLKAIWKAYKGKRAGPTREGDNWILKDLKTALGFDDEEQTRIFCEQQGFTIAQSENGDPYMDLASADGGSFADLKIQKQQTFSRSLVESKRLGRTLPAVINGMSASQAQAQGFVEELTDAETISTGNEESLFVDGDSEDEQMQSCSESEIARKRPVNGDGPKIDATASPFMPFISPALGIVPGSSPYPTSHSGKQNGKSHIQTSQAESTNPLNLNSGPSTQNTPALVGIKEAPKLKFFAPATMDEKGEAKKSSGSLSGKSPLGFEVGAAAKAAQPSNTNNSLGSSLFAKPSGATPGILNQPSTSTCLFSPAQQKTVSDQPSTSSPFTASGPAKSLFDKPSTTSAPSAFSFGTSPLFQSVTKDQIPTTQNIELSSQQNDESRKPSPFSTLTTSSTLANTFFPPKPTVEPASPSPTKGTFAPPVALTSTSPALEEVRNSKPPESASFAPKSTTEGLLHQSLGSTPSQSHLTSPYQKPSTEDLSQQRFPTTSTLPSLGLSTSLTTASALSGSTAVETISGSPARDTMTVSAIPPDPRSATLDKLAKVMMLGEKGLLQQFVEFTVDPIIESSIKQLEDEDSWEQARECRVILLSKKYLRIWRANAWSMSLMRKARERRKIFAKSVQDSARSTPDRQSVVVDSFRSSVIGHRSPPVRQPSAASTMPPPFTPSQGWQSLLTEVDHTQVQSELGKGTKRKRDVAIKDDNYRTPKTTRISHRRSQTVGGSIMSAPPHGLSHNPYKSRIDISTVPEGSMLEDILRKQARRLAPTAKSDTTRTDYFRLKALGIDPDTPVVPLSKKRTRAESLTNGDSSIIETVAHETQPGGQSATRRRSPNPANPCTIRQPAKNEEDEALFAQIRSVREALAESEQWMQSERQSMERSTASKQVSMSPPESETPAQRRLREIKERGHQPSRTEVRLRAMGDKALLPKGFWDGEGMGLSLMKGKGKEEEDGTGAPAAPLFPFGQQVPNGVMRQPPNGLMGFAALGQMNGVVPSHQGFHRPDSEGASADEAIVL